MSVANVTWTVVELIVFVSLLVYAIWKRAQRAQKQYPQSKPERKGQLNEDSKRTDVEVQAEIVRRVQLGSNVDLMDLPVTKLPQDVDYSSVESLALCMPTSDVDLSVLAGTQVNTLTLQGPPLRLTHLEVFRGMKALKTLDLLQCRTVVDDNNSVKGFVKAADLHTFAREAQESGQLSTLILPPNAAFVVGKITRVFPKPSVAVVCVSQQLAVGDDIYFERSNNTFEGASAHTWQSKQTHVERLSTDDHRDVQKVKPTPGLPASHLDNQIALKVTELGKVGDRAVWIGFSTGSQ
eukprot:m.362533 g.362533  ORF g.362533 m.362533 type:complete len:294 (-) comp20619_c0_seq1:249-1130(-)